MNTARVTSIQSV